jgi:hypothetical protein
MVNSVTVHNDLAVLCWSGGRVNRRRWLPLRHSLSSERAAFRPELFKSAVKRGIAQPKGVLLYVPPGTGKTLLARAVPHHTEFTFIRVSGIKLVHKFIGEGSSSSARVVQSPCSHGCA